MLYGAILIFTILVMPRGIVGTLYAWRSKRGA
jgi:ABC-type branched-subunit amino acid transport system permease subunit